MRQTLAAAGTLTADTLFWIFVAGAAIVAWVLVVRVLQLTALRFTAARRFTRVLGRAFVVVTLLYCAGALALVCNATLDRSPAEVRRADLVQLSAAWLPFGLRLAWADVAYLDAPRRVVSIVLVPGLDGIWLNQGGPGLPLRIRSRIGFLGLLWIEDVIVDEEVQLRRTVNAVPTAATTRKALIARLVATGHWAEAQAQAKAHLRAYPEDRAYVAGVAATLRSAGQRNPAADLEQALGR